MNSTQAEPVWTNYYGKKSPISKLDDQHLSNIYWYNLVFFGNDFISRHIISEIVDRFSELKPLPWKPLPIPREIQNLKKLGLIHGDDIIFQGEVIGTIGHINSRKNFYYNGY